LEKGGSGKILKRKRFDKISRSGSELGSDQLYLELEAEAKNPKSEEAETKNIILLPHPWFQ